MERTETKNISGERYVADARPGAVIGQPGYGSVDVVEVLDEVARGEVAGYNERHFGMYRQLFPRISRRDMESLALSRLPEKQGYLEDLCSNLPGLSEAARVSLMARRKAVEQVCPDGSTRVVLVSRLPDGMDEIDIVQQEEYDDTALSRTAPRELVGEGHALSEAVLRTREKKRTYNLLQVFNDMPVLDKYPVPLRVLETAKRCSVSNPKGAAQMLQDSMNLVQDKVYVKVNVGDVAQDKSQAKVTLRLVCANYPAKSASVESEVIADEIFMYGPGTESSPRWHVRGPLKYAQEVMYMYWFVWAEGCVFTQLLLEYELVMLSILVDDGNTSAMPEISYHAGEPGLAKPFAGMSERVSATVGVDKRLDIMRLGDRLVEVTGPGGEQIATSIRVTSHHVLLNNHVYESEQGCLIAGKSPVMKSQISRDLVVTELEGEASPWVLREPEVGELAVVCYLVDGCFSCSSPVQVVSVDESCVVTSKAPEVTYGVSGGALVALGDLALLGVHSASTTTRLVAYRFGSKQFADLLDDDGVSSFSRHSDTGTFANHLMVSFKKRGLGHVFSAAVSCLEPVFLMGSHVGMAVRTGRYGYTTCDAEVPLRYGQAKVPHVVDEVVKGHVYRYSASTTVSGPVFRRNPNYYERVFVVGFDEEDAYVSAETQVVHIAPGFTSFVIGCIGGVDKPVRGGLVMAHDGAVLGICGVQQHTLQVGLGITCWPLPVDGVVEKPDARGVVAKAFPFLNLPAWQDALFEEVFTHASVGKYEDERFMNKGMKPLASVGGQAAKAELFASLRQAGVPYSTWAERLVSLQSKEVYASVADKFGLAVCLRVGSGVTPVLGVSRVYADVVEALLGAAYLVEHRVVFQQLCAAMGLLHVEKGMERSVSVDFGKVVGALVGPVDPSGSSSGSGVENDNTVEGLENRSYELGKSERRRTVLFSPGGSVMVGD